MAKPEIRLKGFKGEWENYTLKENGCLADIVPTLIDCMGEEKPAEMTGESLLIKK